MIRGIFRSARPCSPVTAADRCFDASGHLVGIVTAKLDARVARFTGDVPQNVNFALKAEVARTFLDSKGIAYQTARSEQQLSPADVGDIARPFTVHIECEQAGSRSAAPSNRSSPTPKPSAPAQSAASPAPTPRTGEAPCGSFQKLSNGRWSVVKQIRIQHGNASTVLDPGSLLGPGTRVAGIDVYAELERNCH
jgi:hypothetical protein